MGRTVKGKYYSDSQEDRFKFVEEISLPALRVAIPIPAHLTTMYTENRISGRSAELTHDASRLYDAILEVYQVYLKLESSLFLATKKEQKEIMKKITDYVYTYDSCRYYFMHHWSKEYSILLD